MSPILTIAIPTYNRADYLALNLSYLERELHHIDHSQVEVLISDNASTDHTGAVVEAASSKIALRYLRQETNIISDENFVICYQQARGQYLLLLSDDDILWNGALAFVLELIEKNKPGVICLRAFGYDLDPASEWPDSSEGVLCPLSPDEFLAQSGALITLISSCVMRRTDFDPRSYIDTNLVHVAMVMEALGTGPGFVTRRYWLACKRNNSGGYDFFNVFVGNLFDILENYIGKGLTVSGLQKFGRRLLLQFFPQYLFRAIRSGGDLVSIRAPFEKRFSREPVFVYALRPIFYVPRKLAVLWLALFALAGRLIYGDGRRIFVFLRNRLRQSLRQT